MDRRQARAFEGFVAESGDALLRMATLLTSDPDVAEDVYQDTLQRLAARWPRVDNPRAFRAPARAAPRARPPVPPPTRPPRPR